MTSLSDDRGSVPPEACGENPNEQAGPGSALGLPAIDRQRVLDGLFGTPPAQEQTLGRFRIIRRLGRGAMGTVFEAHDPSLDRTVAIKVLHDASVGSHQQRLLREARALARLSHANVVQVFETGEIDGCLCITMECVHGQTLWDWQQQAHPWRECLEVYLQAGRGLAAAHDMKIVHRDFKPANCILDDQRRVRVLDFGLARGLGDLEDAESEEAPHRLQSQITTNESNGEISPLAQGPEQRLTQTGAILGTPAYMAPEQATRMQVDARADQFSFCVSLYEALFGARPFAGRTGLFALTEGARPPFDFVSSHASQPHVPAWLCTILGRGLQPRREDRFDDMRALLEAIEGRLRTQRRRLTALALGGGLLATVGITRALSPDGSSALCSIDASVLDGTWDATRRTTIHTAFEDSGLPFATVTHEAIDSGLERWTQSWVDARRRACRATRIEGIASQAQLARRTRCLDRQRRRLDGVLAVLSEASPRVVGRAPEIVWTLPSVDECDDPPEGPSATLRPDDPVAVDTIESAEASLARARALLAIGSFDEAERLAGEAEEAGDTVGYRPLELEARAVRARGRMLAGEIDAGAWRLLDTIAQAERARLDPLVTELRVDLARTVAGNWSKPDLERVLLSQAEAWLGRSDTPVPRLEHAVRRGRVKHSMDIGEFETALEQADALRGRSGASTLDRVLDGRITGQLLASLGRHDDAAAQFETTRALAQDTWGAGSWRTIELGMDLGALAMDRGDFDAAQTELALAEQQYQQVLGPDAIDVYRARFRRAKIDLSRGEFERARERLEEIVEVFERVLGPDHVETSEAYNGLGVVGFFVGDFTASIAAYQHALRGAKHRHGDLHQEVGLLYSNLGESLAAKGEHQAAVMTYRKALDVLAVTVGPTHPLNALPLKGSAQSLMAEERMGDALPLLERALALYGDSNAEPFERADVQRSLALALAATDGDAGRIAALAREATRAFETLGMPAEAESLASLATTSSSETTMTTTKEQGR